MGKIKFGKKKNIDQKPKSIKNPYAFLGHVNTKELKYLVPWAQYDEENRVVEHFQLDAKKIENSINEPQIRTQSINSDVALKIILNELYDRQ